MGVAEIYCIWIKHVSTLKSLDFSGMRKFGVSRSTTLFMPRDYTQHPFCKFVRENFEQLPTDVNLITGPADASVSNTYSRFLLGMISPVLKTSLEFSNEKIEVDISQDVSTDTWRMIQQLVIGHDVDIGLDSKTQIDSMIRVGRAAIFLQIDTLSSVVEDRLITYLTLSTCAQILDGTVNSGMTTLEDAAMNMALTDFVGFSKTDGFQSLSYEVLSLIIGNEKLHAQNEEFVLQAVIGWFLRQPPDNNLESIFGLIRFTSIPPQTLALITLREDLPAKVLGMMQEAVVYGLLPSNKLCEFRSTNLSKEATKTRRTNCGTDFFAYDPQFKKNTGGVFITCMGVCGNLICCGRKDGYITAYDCGVLTPNTAAVSNYPVHGTNIITMVAFGDNLVSASSSMHFQLKVSDPRSGLIKGEIPVNAKKILSMAKSNILLFVAIEKGGVLAFCTEHDDPRSWQLAYELKMDNSNVFCTVVQTFSNCVFAGTNKGSIFFWNIESGERTKTIKEANEESITAVVKYEEWLVIAFDHNLRITVRSWDDHTIVCKIPVNCPVENLYVCSYSIFTISRNSRFRMAELSISRKYEDDPLFVSSTKPTILELREGGLSFVALEEEIFSYIHGA